MTTPSRPSPSPSLVNAPLEVRATIVVLPSELARIDGETESLEGEKGGAAPEAQGATGAISFVEDEAWAVYQRAVTSDQGPVAGPVPEDTRPAGAAAEAAALLTAAHIAIARTPATRREVPAAQRLLPGPSIRHKADPAAPTPVAAR